MAAVTYRAGLIERGSLKQIMHRLMIGTRSPAEIAPIAASFASRQAIAPGARARIASDRAAGYRIVVATAAYRFYAAPLVATLGIDDLIATEAATDAKNRVLPRIVGENCYGRDKLAMIQRWLAEHGIDRKSAHIRFYSDHASDLPTFDWADEAFAVNPHASLRRLASERSWPVLHWR